MGFSPYLPGAGGGTGGGRSTVNAGTFADLAALNVWGAANLDSLYNSTTQVTVATVGADSYEWTGDDQPTTYPQGGAWRLDESGLTQSERNAISSITSGTENTIPMFTPTGIGDSIATQPDNSGVVFDGEIRTTKDTVRVGESLSLSEDGADIKATNMLENIEALPLRTILNTDGTTGGNFAVRRSDRQTVVLQGNDTQTRDGDYSFHAPITDTRIAKAITVRFAQAATGIRLTLRNAENIDDLDGNIIFQSHTDAEWNDGAGFNVPATGDFTINIPNSAKFIQDNFVYVTVEQNTQGTGTLSVRGFNTTIGPISGFFPYLSQTFVIESLDEVALQNDLRPQVIEVTGNLTISGANVDTYRDKILQYNGSSNVTITIAATDTFNELDSFSVWNSASNNSRVTVTQTGGEVGGRTNYRVRRNDFAEFTYDGTSDWFVRKQSFSLNSAQSDWNETDTESVSFIRNKPTGITPRTDEEIRDVTQAQLVAGTNVTIVVDDINDTITINSTGNGGGTNPPADADRIYYGLSSSSDTTSIDVTTLTRENDPTDPDTISSGTATQGQYFVLYVPMTHDITSITDTVLQQDVTDLFTSLDNAQLIDTIQFKSYIIGPLNAGFDESYEVAF